MWRVAAWVAVALVGAGAAGCGPVEAAADSLSPELRIQAATVTLEGRCAGVVAEGEWRVVTAAHCIRPGEQQVRLTFFDGSELTGNVAAVDRMEDMAILSLEEPAPVMGLAIGDWLPNAGSAGYFAGRFDRGAQVQQITIVKLGRCPSLPGVPEALFTSLRGEPGDSGAPVVDTDLNVIGLVHGGARCSIAAPTHDVPRMLRELDPQS